MPMPPWITYRPSLTLSPSRQTAPTARPNMRPTAAPMAQSPKCHSLTPTGGLSSRRKSTGSTAIFSVKALPKAKQPASLASPRARFKTPRGTTPNSPNPYVKPCWSSTVAPPRKSCAPANRAGAPPPGYSIAVKRRRPPGRPSKASPLAKNPRLRDDLKKLVRDVLLEVMPELRSEITARRSANSPLGIAASNAAAAFIADRQARLASLAAEAKATYSRGESPDFDALWRKHLPGVAHEQTVEKWDWLRAECSKTRQKRSCLGACPNFSTRC